MTRRPAAALVAALLLIGCGTDANAPAGRGEPITLTFPYADIDGVRFPDRDRVAAAAAPGYVAVKILADPATVADTGATLVNIGSGTLIDPAGLVVTAAHIAIDDRYGAVVTTVDGREHRGEVVHVARDRELALIRIPPVPGWPPMALADSSTLAPGQVALAIGSRRDARGTVSTGAIREPRLDYPLDNSGFTIPAAIVLRMEIDFHHSGGPLVDADGRLIGIIVGLDISGNHPEPIAFAVPSNEIAAYVRRIAAR